MCWSLFWLNVKKWLLKIKIHPLIKALIQLSFQPLWTEQWKKLSEVPSQSGKKERETKWNTNILPLHLLKKFSKQALKKSKEQSDLEWLRLRKTIIVSVSKEISKKHSVHSGSDGKNKNTSYKKYFRKISFRLWMLLFSEEAMEYSSFDRNDLYR